MKAKHYPIIVNIICYCCILLFIYAAANKLFDYQKFKVQLGQSPILTDYAEIIAWIIPTIEIIISLLLTYSKTMLAGLYATFSIMFMFTIYIIVILNFSERVPCSCGGILEKMGWQEHLIFNVAYLVFALIGVQLQIKITERKQAV